MRQIKGCPNFVSAKYPNNAPNKKHEPCHKLQFIDALAFDSLNTRRKNKKIDPYKQVTANREPHNVDKQDKNLTNRNIFISKLENQLENLCKV